MSRANLSAVTNSLEKDLTDISMTIESPGSSYRWTKPKKGNVKSINEHVRAHGPWCAELAFTVCRILTHHIQAGVWSTDS